MNAEWAAVAVAIVAVVVTAGIEAWQSRQSRFALGVDLLLKLDERFNSALLEARATAAGDLPQKRSGDGDDVLDFFDTLGLLVRKGALSEELVWHTFFYWIQGYWWSARTYVRERRDQDPTVWEDFARLYEGCARIHMKKRSCSEKELELDGAAVRRFLLEEAGSGTEVRPARLTEGDRGSRSPTDPLANPTREDGAEGA